MPTKLYHSVNVHKAMKTDDQKIAMYEAENALILPLLQSLVIDGVLFTPIPCYEGDPKDPWDVHEFRFDCSANIRAHLRLSSGGATDFFGGRENAGWHLTLSRVDRVKVSMDGGKEVFHDFLSTIQAKFISHGDSLEAAHKAISFVSEFFGGLNPAFK